MLSDVSFINHFQLFQPFIPHFYIFQLLSFTFSKPFQPLIDLIKQLNHYFYINISNIYPHFYLIIWTVYSLLFACLLAPWQLQQHPLRAYIVLVENHSITVHAWTGASGFEHKVTQQFKNIFFLKTHPFIFRHTLGKIWVPSMAWSACVCKCVADTTAGE